MNHSMIPSRATDIFLLQSVQKSTGAQSASHSMGTRGSFPGVMQPQHKADDTPPLVRRERISEAVSPFLHTPS